MTAIVHDDIRANVHAMWASVADRWGEHADYIDARGAEVTARLLELTAPQAGERVLELACGTGAVGIAAAELGAEVVLSDVAPEMTALAAARAAGLDNVSARPLDLEAIDEPDASFDVVLCREGLMFAVDPVAAAREVRRVLRPGGRFAVAVWGPRERNPWLALVFDAVSAQIGAPMPPPGVPGPFSLDDAARLAGVLRSGGLDAVAVSELAVPLRAGSFDEWFTRTSAIAGPLAQRLAAMPEARASRAARPARGGDRGVRHRRRARDPGRVPDRLRARLGVGQGHSQWCRAPRPGTLGSMNSDSPRKLTRSTSDKVLGGVAGGLAEYFSIDPLVVRIGFVASLLFSGAGLFAYAALLIFVPADTAALTPVAA